MTADTTSRLEGSVEPPARKLGGVKAVGILGILVGLALIAAGIVVWVMVAAGLQGGRMAFSADALTVASVGSFAAPALAIVVGILSVLFGWALHRLASAPVVVRPATVV